MQYPELRSCVKAEVAIPGFPSLIRLMVSVDVRHHQRRRRVQCRIVSETDETASEQLEVVERLDLTNQNLLLSFLPDGKPKFGSNVGALLKSGAVSG